MPHFGSVSASPARNTHIDYLDLSVVVAASLGTLYSATTESFSQWTYLLHNASGCAAFNSPLIDLGALAWFFHCYVKPHEYEHLFLIFEARLLSVHPIDIVSFEF